jgi:hypothetical protein
MITFWMVSSLFDPWRTRVPAGRRQGLANVPPVIDFCQFSVGFGPFFPVGRYLEKTGFAVNALLLGVRGQLNDHGIEIALIWYYY